MTTMESTAETRWIKAVGEFVCVSEAIQTQLDALNHRTEALQQTLQTAVTTLPRKGPMLEHGGRQLEQAVADAIHQATQTWGEGALGRQFSDSMADRLILLIYGKVNAGKSTLLNFLVERFAAHGLPAQRFRIENGHEVALEGPFETSCTENTAHIQGVKLGETLVVLDTPGMLSVTQANHALTERFRVAADAALLVTSSGAPGETQELDVLRTAAESGKPIQILLTQSDVNEPMEVDGEIHDRWVNKDPARRLGQEEDVLTRARCKLNDEGVASLLEEPVSVSVKCAREAGCTPAALEESGFERLYQRLCRLADSALEYKREKPLKIYQDYLQNVLYLSLRTKVLPPLEDLRSAGRQAIERLGRQTRPMSEAVLVEMIGALPAVLRRHQERQDVQAVAQELSMLLATISQTHLLNALADYETQAEAILIDLDPGRFGGYTERFINVEQQRGAGLAAAAGAGGTALGVYGAAKLGTVIGTAGGPLGMVVGGLIGGLVGTAIGRLALTQETLRLPVGVDYSELQTRIEDLLQAEILNLMDTQISRVCTELEELDGRLSKMQSLVDRFIEPIEATELTPVGDAA